jgi:thioredoxin-related protein
MNPIMRILISFLLVILLIFSSCRSEKSYYLVDDANLVLKKARHDKKFIFLDFYTVWCGGCKAYEKYTFVDSTFKKYLTENFYSSRINAELAENKKITKKYAISGYPTVIIADPDGEEIDRIIGYNDEGIGKLIERINSIIKGKENLIYLDSLYNTSPDSIELFRKIAGEKIWFKDDYKNLMKFSESAISKSHNPDLRNEARFYFAIGAVNDGSNQNPQPLKDLLNSRILLDSNYLETCNNQLLYFYQRINNLDSIDHYYSVLIKFTRPGGHFGYIRDYARFLYENNRKIGLADRLTKEYISFPGFEADHWSPFLTAHSLARQNNVLKGVEIFDKWMDKYNPPDTQDKSQWPYVFYIDYALYYKVSLDKALGYAKELEHMNASKYNKKLLAELFYLNNKNDLAIEKLKEITEMIETDKEKKEIDELKVRYMKK